jgi:hypothetical protein
LRILESGRVSSIPTTVAINFPSISAISSFLASKAAISASTGHTSTYPPFNASIFVSIGPSFLSLGSNRINIAEQLRKFLGSISNVDTLILAILINEMELPKHSEEGDVLAGVVYYSFGTILHKEFEQLKRLPMISVRIAGDLAVVEYLVDLPPFLRSLVCETLVY